MWEFSLWGWCLRAQKVTCRFGAVVWGHVWKVFQLALEVRDGMWRLGAELTHRRANNAEAQVVAGAVAALQFNQTREEHGPIPSIP